MSTTDYLSPHQHLAKWAGIFLFATVPLAYAHNGHNIVLYTKLFVVQVGTLLMASAWLVGVLKKDIPHQRYPLDLPVLLFVLILLLSWATLAINPFKSGLVVAKLSTFALLYFSTSRTFHISFLKPWVYVITITAALVSTIGICQYFAIGFLWLKTSGLPSSTLVMRNVAAMYLVGAIPVAIAPFLWASKIKNEITWGFLFTLPVIFLIYTRTRGAWVGLCMAVMISVLLLLYLKYRSSQPNTGNQRLTIPDSSIGVNRSKAVIGFLLFLFIVFMSTKLPKSAPITIPHQTNQISNLRMPLTVAATADSILPRYKSSITNAITTIPSTGNDRFIMWKNTLKMVQDHWLLGVGIGNWDLIYPQYERGELLRPNYYAKRPHNDFLWVAAETGIFSLFFFLILWGKSFFILFFAKNKSTSNSNNISIPSSYAHRHTKIILPCLGVSLLAILGHACFSFPYERISSLLFLFTFMSIASAHNPWSFKKQMPSQLACFLPILSILCLLLCLASTARAIHSDQLYQTLTRYYLKEDWQNVIDLSDQALKNGVIDHKILLWIAHAHKQKGDLSQALKTYQICLRYHPNEMTAYAQIGRIEQTRGNLQAAQNALEKAVFLDDNNAEFHHDLGIVYQLQDKLDAAHQTYQKAISFGATDLTIYINLGGIYERQNQISKAIKTYTYFIDKWQGDTAISTRIKTRLHHLKSF